MRWGLVPWWWSKPLKELRMATFNARAETVETKPVFRDAFNRKRCLVLKSCTMIITEPNELAAEIHDRMPVFLTQRSGPASDIPLQHLLSELLTRFDTGQRCR